MSNLPIKGLRNFPLIKSFENSPNEIETRKTIKTQKNSEKPKKTPKNPKKIGKTPLI